jgi:hypothetical protein
MKQGKIILNNFKENIKRSLDNTLNFENHTIFEKYDYEQESKKTGSILNLCFQYNFIYTILVPHLREVSPLQAMSKDDREKFNHNPFKLSYYKYGIIDYWWILLAVNGYFNPSEFHDFYFLRIPLKSDISSILDREMFNNTMYGKIPE